jgi:hypothetical protein
MTSTPTITLTPDFAPPCSRFSVVGLVELLRNARPKAASVGACSATPALRTRVAPGRMVLNHSDLQAS